MYVSFQLLEIVDRGALQKVLPEPAIKRLLGNKEKFDKLVPKVRYNNENICNLIKIYIITNIHFIQKRVYPELEDFLKVLGLEDIQKPLEENLKINK